MIKKCNTCGIEQLIENFHRASREKDGHRGECKSCRKNEKKYYNSEKRKQQYWENKEEENKKNRLWWSLHKEEVAERRKSKYDYTKTKDTYLNWKYGISMDVYSEILEAQKYRCAICGCDSRLQQKALAVDHDHETGKVRGLLCTSCNTAIGSFKDSVELLYKAIEYLRSVEQMEQIRVNV